VTGVNIIRRCHALILATGFIALVAAGVRHGDASQAADKSTLTTEAVSAKAVCEREAVALMGKRPPATGTMARAPKKIRDVAPAYPSLPSGTVISDGRSMWIAVVLLDLRGNVARVWLSRRIAFSIPFPRFDESILAAIRQWKFEPTIVDGQAVAVCMSVVSIVDWN
jgi:outer membrane biosynthesis protein TonB